MRSRRFWRRTGRRLVQDHIFGCVAVGYEKQRRSREKFLWRCQKTMILANTAKEVRQSRFIQVAPGAEKMKGYRTRWPDPAQRAIHHLHGPPRLKKCLPIGFPNDIFTEGRICFYRRKWKNRGLRARSSLGRSCVGAWGDKIGETATHLVRVSEKSGPEVWKPNLATVAHLGAGGGPGICTPCIPGCQIWRQFRIWERVSEKVAARHVSLEAKFVDGYSFWDGRCPFWSLGAEWGPTTDSSAAAVAICKLIAVTQGWLIVRCRPPP